MSDLRAGAPFLTAGLSIVPIEAVHVEFHEAMCGFFAGGFKEPVAIIVLRAGAVIAFDLAGNEMELGPLIDGVPGLDSVIAGCWP